MTEHDPEKSRKGLYRISDPFVGTWFGFVHPHLDALERGHIADVLAREIGPQLTGHLSRAVEPVIRELLRSPPLSRHVPFEPFYAGRYWSPTAELDVVLLDQAREQAFIAEIRWSSRPISPAVLDDLRERVAREGVFEDLSHTCAVVSRSGFSGPRRTRARGLIDLSRLRW